MRWTEKKVPAPPTLPALHHVEELHAGVQGRWQACSRAARGRSLRCRELAPLQLRMSRGSGFSAICWRCFGLRRCAVLPVPSQAPPIPASKERAHMVPHVGRHAWGPVGGAGGEMVRVGVGLRQ